jgi:hypothetical protein
VRRADGKAPMHLGQCVAWALDGPVVAQVYPEFAAFEAPPADDTPAQQRD